MIIYLLKFSSLLVLAAIGYFVFLRNIKHYAVSRNYILGSIFLSLFLPNIPNVKNETFNVFSIVLPELIIETNGTTAASLLETNSINLFNVVGMVYLLISIVFIAKLFFSLWKLNQIIRNSTIRSSLSTKYYTSDLVKNPFSFFSYIVIPYGVTYQPAELEAIVRHEKLHVQYNHSFEKIILELFKCIFWWHPVVWYYAKQLDLIHEYQVDEAMSAQMDFTEYKKLLIGLIVYPTGLRFVNPISSNIKKRLKMMNQKKKNNTPFRYLGLTALIVLGSLCIYSCQKEEAHDLIPSDNRSNTNAVDLEDSNNSYTYESIDTFTTFDYYTYEETVELIKSETTVYKTVETMPLFPGCNESSPELLKECSNKELLQFIYTNITYPAEARKAGIEGTMVVQFIVSSEGEIYAIEYKRTVGAEFEETINNMLEKMNEEITWIPGKHNGKNVDVQYTLPVKFKLQN